MKWVALTAAVFQFLAFWFAAPELLGEPTLKRFENGLKRLMTSIPMVVVPVGMALYGGVFITLAFIKVLKSQEVGLEEGEMTTYFISLGIGTMLYFAFIFQYKKLKSWLERKVSKPLVERLITHREMRKNALVVGSILFTIGFALQCLTILW